MGCCLPSHTYTCPHRVLPLSGQWAQRSILPADAAQLTSQGFLLHSPSTRLPSNTFSCTRSTKTEPYENRTLPRPRMPRTVAVASSLCRSPPPPKFCLHVFLPPAPPLRQGQGQRHHAGRLNSLSGPFWPPLCAQHPRPLLPSLDPASGPQAAPWPSTASLWPPFFLNPRPLFF